SLHVAAAQESGGNANGTNQARRGPRRAESCFGRERGVLHASGPTAASPAAWGDHGPESNQRGPRRAAEQGGDAQRTGNGKAERALQSKQGRHLAGARGDRCRSRKTQSSDGAFRQSTRLEDRGQAAENSGEEILPQ